MYVSDLSHDNRTLEDKLTYLYDLRRDIKLDLGLRHPYRDLLKAFGDPHLHLPPVIHVAGTNGKGSVIAMMCAMLEASGYSVHVYTSPHLLKFNERIVLSGKVIGDDDLNDLLDETLLYAKDMPLTFFEATTAMALAAFARHPADIVLLETGLGGRLDCTNVVEKPLATVITKIGMDHEEFLGDTIDKIAFEKAGIMKEGVVCVIGAQVDPDVLDVFEKRAGDLSVPLIQADVSIPAAPHLVGVHQFENAALAVTCVRNLSGFDIGEEDIAEGLRTVRWPARLEKITPVSADGFDIWFDGGHNPDAAGALKAQMDAWRAEGQDVHLIIGMMGHKNPRAFIQTLAQSATSLTFTDMVREPKSLGAEALSQYAEGLCVRNVHEGIRHIRQNYSGGVILVTGSLYLYGYLFDEISS